MPSGWKQNQISPTIKDINEKLVAYNKESDARLAFELEDGKRLRIRPQTLPMSRGANCVEVFSRRTDPGNRYREIVCAESKDILLVTIASSPNTFDEYIRPWFEHKRIRTNHFRVLAWCPLVPDKAEPKVQNALCRTANPTSNTCCPHPELRVSIMTVISRNFN